jgi:hypothetical protein
MTDQQMAIQAVSEAQRSWRNTFSLDLPTIEHILSKLVEVLDRPDLLVAVSRLQQRNCL